MGEVIVVTSGKGGVGKTTTTANLGVRLAVNGFKTIMIDTDIGLRNLDVVMGLENRIVYNLVDVITGICRIKQALIRDKRYTNLYLLPSAQAKDKTAVSPPQMKKLIDALKNDFDYILIDCPAGIEQGFKNAIAGADRALIVTTPEISSLRDADRINMLLEKAGITDKKLIINRIRQDMVKRKTMMSPEDITKVLDIELIGLIYDDENIIIASDNGQPIAETMCRTGRAYDNIAKRVAGENVPYLYKSSNKIVNLFSKISPKQRKIV